MADSKNYSGKPVWETDKHVLVEKDNSGAGAILVLVGIIIAIVLMTFSFILLILPLLIALIGFFISKSNRYWIGISTIIVQIYLYFELQERWISGFLIFGYHDLKGIPQEGLFTSIKNLYESYSIYFVLVNLIGVLLGVFFIFQSYYLRKSENENFENQRIGKETKIKNQFQNKLNEAIEKYKSDDFTGALSDLIYVTHLDPKNSIAFYYRAMTRMNVRNYKGIIAEYTKGVIQNYKGIIDDFNTAIELNPNYTEAIENREKTRIILDNLIAAEKSYDMGIQNLNKERSSEAILHFTEAIRLNKNYPEAHCYLGLANRMSNESQQAIKEYERAIEIYPKYMFAFYNMGIDKIIIKDYKGAIQSLSKSIDLKPKHMESYYQRSIAKSYLMDFVGALDDINKVIIAKPKLAEAYYYRGIYKIKLGQKENGLLDLSKSGELGYEEAYQEIKKSYN